MTAPWAFVVSKCIVCNRFSRDTGSCFFTTGEDEFVHFPDRACLPRNLAVCILEPDLQAYSPRASTSSHSRPEVVVGSD